MAYWQPRGPTSGVTITLKAPNLFKKSSSPSSTSTSRDTEVTHVKSYSSSKPNETPSFSQPIYCIKCGNKLTFNARFCTSCGNKVAPVSANSSSSSVPPYIEERRRKQEEKQRLEEERKRAEDEQRARKLEEEARERKRLEEEQIKKEKKERKEQEEKLKKQQKEEEERIKKEKKERKEQEEKLKKQQKEEESKLKKEEKERLKKEKEEKLNQKRLTLGPSLEASALPTNISHKPMNQRSSIAIMEHPQNEVDEETITSLNTANQPKRYSVGKVLFCGSCGKEMIQGAKFCGDCGWSQN